MPKKLEGKNKKKKKIGIRRCRECKLRAHKSEFLSFLVKNGVFIRDEIGESARHVYFCQQCFDLKKI